MDTLQERILIVDDDPINVRVLVEFLRADYSLTIARDGPQTLERLKAAPLPDLILLDLMMPGMDGFEVCRRIKADPALRGVPIIVVTALNQPFDESAAFDAGAVDFLTKPIAPAVLLARVRTQLRLRRSERLLQRQNQQLDEQARDRARELAQTQAVMLYVLATLAAQQDPGAMARQRRLRRYVQLLARAARQRPDFAARLPERSVEAMARFAPLHGIGRVAAALPLPASSPAEHPRSVLERQAAAARDLLLSALEGEGAGDSEFLRVGVELLVTQHEHWDGTGSPQGLAGEDIPLAGRLMAIASAYDEQLAQPSWSADAHHHRAVQAVKDGSGSRFDPGLVAVFLSVASEMREAAGQGADDPA